MTIQDFIDNVEIQSEFVVCYYDYKKGVRVIVELGQYRYEEMKYVYIEDDILYIEFEIEFEEVIE